MKSKINRIITIWTICITLLSVMSMPVINIASAAVEPALSPLSTINSDCSPINIGTHNQSTDALNANDEPGDITSPAVLPTRQNGKIAFSVSFNENRTNSIFTVNPDGTNRQQVYTESFGSVNLSPSFSPDGTRIAFASNRTGSGDIYTINADGTNLQRVTTSQALDSDPSFSPDGTRIAFHRSNGIYVINTDGSNERLITISAVADTQPSWSPDGTRLAFHRVGDNTDIYTINVDGTNLQRVTSNPAYEASPAWSPDGTRIAFFSTRNGNDDIYTINTDGTNEQRLTTSSFSDSNPSWSPDGTRIAFQSRRTGNSDIYTMNVDGTNVQQVTNSADGEFGPSWGGSTLPSGWNARDIGNVGAAGSTAFNNGTFTVKGSGSDIWHNADSFHFAHQQLSGDGTITARVTSQQNTDQWAKAGVMFRQSLAANAAHAMLIVTPSNGVALQHRVAAGGTSEHQGSGGNVPQWVRLVRQGMSVTGYTSADGINWIIVGTATINLGQTVYVGLAVTAHNNKAVSTATFDNVTVQ